MDQKTRNTYKKCIKSILEFMLEQGLRVEPYPKIQLDDSKQEGIFIKTGYYSPDEQKVVVFIQDRNIKDCLRSFCHEMVHHMQNLQNPDKDWGGGGDLEQDRKLRGIEGEAFLLGNILFREWTEKMKKTKELNESKNILSESHVDEYYHFTEIGNLKSILQSGTFYFAGNNKNSSTNQQFTGMEHAFRGGKNGYISLTRMRSLEQGYQYEQSKFKDAIVRITFDGNALNNIRNVKVKPLDFIYNWNKNVPQAQENPNLYQNETPYARLTGDLIYDKIDSFGKSGRGLYTNTQYNKDFLSGDGYDRKYDKNAAKDVVARQFQSQAEESLVLNNDKGCLDKKELSASIKRIDILILTDNPKMNASYFVKNFGLSNNFLSDRIYIYPKKARGYFNLGKNEGCLSVATIEEDDYWDNYISYQGGLYETVNRSRLDEIEAEIVEPDDVDLSSFNIKRHLNPKFWEDGHLDTRIRLKLLDIADDFFDSLGVDWVEPEDVIVTGSLANYNWNDRYSDIDLHILVDYEDVDERVDFVREYFTLKKNAWNEKHKSLKIFGFPVEVYVQDVNEPHASSGVYSVDKDKWLTEPDLENLRSGHVDKKHIREMVSTYMNKIDCLIDIYKKHKDDEYEMEKVAKDAAEIFDEIKKMRKDDLGKYGREMCDGNIIFKALRRSDYIGKLLKLRDLTYDKINSL